MSLNTPPPPATGPRPGGEALWSDSYDRPQGPVVKGTPGAAQIEAEWIRRMRDLRNSLETNGGGNPPKGSKNVGRWRQVCADLFHGLDDMHANGMIRGWEALWGDSQFRPSGPELDSPPKAAQIAAEPILRTLGAPEVTTRRWAAAWRGGKLCPSATGGTGEGVCLPVRGGKLCPSPSWARGGSASPRCRQGTRRSGF